MGKREETVKEKGREGEEKRERSGGGIGERGVRPKEICSRRKNKKKTTKILLKMLYILSGSPQPRGMWSETGQYHTD